VARSKIQADAVGRAGETRMNTKQQSSLSLLDILAVENDPALLDFKCSQTGLLLWPMVRAPFVRAIMSDQLYETPLVGSAPPVPKLRGIGALSKAVVHNAIHGRNAKADILLMATGMGNQIKDGRWFNRLSDYFAMERHDQTLVVEDFFDWRWPFPRHNNRVLFHAPTQVAAIMAGRRLCHNEHLLQAQRLMSMVVERSKQILSWNCAAETEKMLVQLLARRTAATPWLYRKYRTMLERVGPKLLIKEEACYGSAAPLMLAAKSLGIATAEYQHGVVAAGHDAYNVAPVLHNSLDYRKTLPDYFLGYGEWWNEQINVPIAKIAIGNPHRSEQVQQYIAHSVQARTDVLVLSDGIETDLYLGLARELAAQLDTRFTVVFRPHPLERAKVLAAFPGGIVDSVRIDQNRDIYQSFLSAYAVVSELSTGLFEAVGLVNRILIWDTAKARFCFPSHPFSVFSDAGDLARKLVEDGRIELATEQGEKIWKPDWRANYGRFLASIGVK
jgi:hypothetical protein